ncbi:FtsX-like permease family protein [Streptomyces sp. NRRL F-5123]|uniref:FtsX-like permease family protein n=1 Tax=Streptomyces sp. NRRL F-5123 TaxID=1463856 RepID=UPI00099BE53D|nr:ABC transporter permease [Streptomyces sp. NRRL F-5123]
MSGSPRPREPFAGFDATARAPHGPTAPHGPAAAHGPAGSSDADRPRAGLRGWAHDLLLGARFAAGGGREGWTRTVLTAVGVGLGVALLLLAAAVPAMMHTRDQRRVARDTLSVGEHLEPSDRTFLLADESTTFRGDQITGVLVAPDGPHAPTPPGVTAIPRPGEMVASPALKKLLAHEPILRERIPYEITGTIGKAGLMGPAELYYYAGSDKLLAHDASGRTGNADRMARYGAHSNSEVLGPVFTLLLIMVVIVLLLPVGVFVATATRLGGERRDRRLAALRLVGADIHATRRIAAGEALLGTLLGVLVGVGFFLGARQLATYITIRDISAFPSDLAPDPLLTVLIVLAVPAAAVAITLLSLRRTAIEPLGVFRDGLGRPRRVWWRIAIPAVGLAMLAPLFGKVRGDASVNEYQVATGAVLLLVGVTAVLPWLVETAVGRLRGGPVSWQLATRRLQLSSGSAGRMVSGVTVAVAGAIALQMLFHAVDGDFVSDTGADTARAQVEVDDWGAGPRTTAQDIRQLAATKGVRDATGYTSASVNRPDAYKLSGDALSADTVSLTVADCASLRNFAAIGKDCGPHSVYLVAPPAGENRTSAGYVTPGARVDLNTDYSDRYTGNPRLWTIPAGARTVASRTDPLGGRMWGIFTVPGVIDDTWLSTSYAEMFVNLDDRTPDAVEYVRNTTARFGLDAYASDIHGTTSKTAYTQLRRGLFAGATLTLVLIGASLLVTMLEQLRERKKLLAVLVAFGTKRSALAWSVLWQTAVPVVIGLALAVAGGVGLGAALLAMVARPFRMDWADVLSMAAIGSAVVLGVTLLSLPLLWRLMRPDGLRVE